MEPAELKPGPSSYSPGPLTSLILVLGFQQVEFVEGPGFSPGISNPHGPGCLDRGQTSDFFQHRLR